MQNQKFKTKRYKTKKYKTKIYKTKNMIRFSLCVFYFCLFLFILFYSILFCLFVCLVSRLVMITHFSNGNDGLAQKKKTRENAQLESVFIPGKTCLDFERPLQV